MIRRRFLSNNRFMFDMEDVDKFNEANFLFKEAKYVDAMIMYSEACLMRGFGGSDITSLKNIESLAEKVSNQEFELPDDDILLDFAEIIRDGLLGRKSIELTWGIYQSLQGEWPGDVQTWCECYSSD